VSKHVSIYLDESGDLGFDFNYRNPSKYFVITLLICLDQNIIDIFKSAVRRTLKNKINHNQFRQYEPKKPLNELKASQIFHHVKEYFYKHVHDNNCWQLYSIILNKADLIRKMPQELQEKNLYNFLARRILEKVKFSENLSKVELIVDKSKTDREIIIFNDYLSNHLASYLPLQTRLVIDHIHSFKNTGLQAVDLFSWGIFRKYEHNDLRWYSTYCHRIVAEEQI
jgi:hypothetical protein